MAYRVPPDNHSHWDGTEEGSKAGEPTLNQLLAEPIIRQLMHCDGIDEDEIRSLVRQATKAYVARLDHPTDDDPHEMVSLLVDITQLWHKRHNLEVRARIPGMTYARSAVLIHLLLHEGLSQASLARFLAIKPLSLARLLNRLEAEGLVVRTPDPCNHRSHIAVLASKLRPAIEDICDRIRRIHRDALAGISEVEVNQLFALLRRVRSNLSEHPQSGLQVFRSDLGYPSIAVSGHLDPKRQHQQPQ